MPRLIVVSLQRSGTNWFQDVCGQVPGVLAMREAFNPVSVFGLHERKNLMLEAMRARFEDPRLEEASETIRAWVADDPLGAARTFEGVASEAGFGFVSYVLFSDHLPEEKARRLLTDTETQVVFLTRASLPRHVSWLKARMIGKWKRVDTTDLRPHVELDRFRTAAEADRAWFARVAEMRAALGMTSPLHLTFEEDVASGAEGVLSRLHEGILGFPAPPNDSPGSKFFKQDRSTDVFATIANGKGLREALDKDNAHGLAFDPPYPSQAG